MAISIPHTFVAGTIASATTVNANFNEVATYVNGLSDGTNIDSSAITTAKIADGAITQAKLAAGVAVAGDSDQVVLGSQVFG
jgi:hypothetical protein